MANNQKILSRLPGRRASQFSLPVIHQPSVPKQVRVHPAIHFLRQHPVVFWSATWVSLLLLMGLSVTTLMSPEFSKHEDLPTVVITPTPEVVEPEERGQSVPVWSFGAIALSCAAGSLALSRKLKSSPRPRKPALHASVAPRPKQPKPKPSSKLVPRPPQATAMAQAQALAAQPPQVGRNPSQVVSQVTVMPSEHMHPLDWDEPSLADSVDLRKRTSVARWLS